MRALLLSVLVLLFCVTTASAQAEMIAHWPFNGNTQEVINGLHGIPSATGVSYVTDDPQRGHVLLLDGHTGVINLPSEIWTEPADTNTSITCWYNWAGGLNWQRVYSLGTPTGNWPLMYLCPRDGWPGNGLHITLHNGPKDIWTDYTLLKNTETTDTIVPNKWYFSAIVIKAHQVKIWHNNQLLMTDTIIVTPFTFQATENNTNVIGKSHWADTTYNGMIDDFRIYGDALTDEEVLALYEEGNVSVPKVKPDADINLYGLDGKIMYSNVDENSVRAVSVYSVTGSLLFRSDRISELQHTKFIPGVYIVRMANNGAILSKKVVIAN